jgi:hypothetical protein
MHTGESLAGLLPEHYGAIIATNLERFAAFAFDGRVYKRP